jgi:ferrous iron transport protein B
MGIGLLTGIAGKEIVVSTLSILYQADENDFQKGVTLKDQLLKKENQITPLSAYAFMVFILIYFPCIAVVAAIRKESERWSWTIFSVVYTTALAWIITF